VLRVWPLDDNIRRDYCNYMIAELIRIGNSKGIRLPRRILELYSLAEGDEIELEERRDGILLKPRSREDRKLGWEDAYVEMARESAERDEWSDWDQTAGDGLDPSDD
jgi:antitoxin MazE